MHRAVLLSTTCLWFALGVACASTEPNDGQTGGAGGGSGSGSSATGGTTGGTSGGSAGSGTSATGGGAGTTTTGGGAGTPASGGTGGVGPSGGQAGTGLAGGGVGAMGGDAPGGMSGGGAGGSAGQAPVVEPSLVTSAMGAYWKEGALMEVSDGNAEVTVSDAMTMQTWDGFGGTFNEAGWEVLGLLTPAERDQAMTLLFGMEGARFAFGRVPIGASDYAVERYTLNENAGDYTMDKFSIEHDQEYLIPYIQAALALKSDVRLWASPWTPPTWMKSNSSFDGGTMLDDDQVLTAHALYLAKFVEEYAKVGIKIEAIHPQNEPNYETRYPSCIWSAALYTKFIRDFLGPTFEERKVSAQIFLGTMSNADAGKDGTIISTVQGDSGAMKYVKGFGLQWNMINSVGGLKSTNLPIVQSEHKCGNYPWEGGFNADQPPNDHAYGVESWGLISDWITAGATSYSAWNMVLDTKGHNSDMMRPWPQNALLIVDRSAKKLILTPTYYVFRHLSEFVDPGAKRIGTMGGDALAFKNPDGTLVAVLYNSGGAKQSIVSLGGKKYQLDLPGNGWATLNVK